MISTTFFCLMARILEIATFSFRQNMNIIISSYQYYNNIESSASHFLKPTFHIF